MLKALPVKNPESIVLLGSRGKEDNKTDFGFYYPVFRKLRERNYSGQMEQVAVTS